MWKTDCWSPYLASLDRHLCPDCDSLGPHYALTEELSSDVLLQCIDCGAMMGRLTPQGIEPLGDLGSSELVMTEMERGLRESDSSLEEPFDKTDKSQPQRICEALQHAFLAGLVFKARQ